MDLKVIILSEKKTTAHGYILCDPIYITLKMIHHRDGKTISGGQGQGWWSARRNVDVRRKSLSR